MPVFLSACSGGLARAPLGRLLYLPVVSHLAMPASHQLSWISQSLQGKIWEVVPLPQAFGIKTHIPLGFSKATAFASLSAK